MRLYDRHVKSGLFVDYGWWGEDRASRMAPSIMDALERAVLVDAGDVVKAWLNESAITQFSGPRILKPPYESLWIEAEMPGPAWTKRVGILIETHKPENYPLPPDKAGVWGGRVLDASAAMSLCIFFDKGPDHSPSALMGPIGITWSMLDERGHLLRMADGEAISITLMPQHVPESEQERYKATMGTLLPMMMHAVHLMNCKNIRVEDEVLKRHDARRRSRMGLGGVKFKTLVIDPSLTPRASSEKGVPIGDMPAHLVRGHFATYSEDKPLFGRYSGTFWKPAHVRGSADNGTVYKDYKVKAPK